MFYDVLCTFWLYDYFCDYFCCTLGWLLVNVPDRALSCTKAYTSFVQGLPQWTGHAGGTSQPLRKRSNLSREAANFVFPGQDLAVWIRHSLILQNLQVVRFSSPILVAWKNRIVWEPHCRLPIQAREHRAEHLFKIFQWFWNDLRFSTERCWKTELS